MTNGEKFKEVFGISQVDEGELYALAWLPNCDVPAEFYIDWWNSEYKAKGFLPKFNKILKTITPQEPKTGHCRDCRWWKDSDGKYRRGCGAESKCPINTHAVYCGEGYCYIYEPQESEEV